MAPWISEAGTSNALRRRHPLPVRIGPVLPIFMNNKPFTSKPILFEVNMKKCKWRKDELSSLNLINKINPSGRKASPDKTSGVDYQNRVRP